MYQLLRVELLVSCFIYIRRDLFLSTYNQLKSSSANPVAVVDSMNNLKIIQFFKSNMTKINYLQNKTGRKIKLYVPKTL